MTELLWASHDLERWHACLNAYGETVEHLVELQEDVKKDKKEENLEKWYNEIFPLKLKERKSNYYLMMDEAVKLLMWKMKRGTFRPGLLKNLKERNRPADIEQRSKEAFSALDKHKDQTEAVSAVQSAIKAITELSYVGPGLGSAVLSLHPSGIAPYMAEETAYEIPDALSKAGKVSWTVSAYVKFVALIREKKEELNSKELDKKSKGREEGFIWTEKNVGDALWTYHFARVWQSDKPEFGKLPVFIDPDTGGWGKWSRKVEKGGSSTKRSPAAKETKTNKRQKAR